MRRNGRTEFRLFVGILLLCVVGLQAVLGAASGADNSDGDGLRDLSTESESAIGYPPSIDLEETKLYGGSRVSNPGWIAALFESDSFICTASLIDPLVVLTAAHCVDRPGNYSVLVGEEYLYGTGVTRTVTDVYLHSGWGGEFNDTDLALLALDSPVTSLPVATLNTTGVWPEFTQSLVIAGWGMYYEGSPASPYLLAGGVSATSGMDGSYDSLWCNLDPSAMTVGGMFCVGGPLEIEVAPCPGDSGAPVLGWLTPTASGGDLTIYGTVSYGPSYCGWNYWDDKAQSIGGHNAWIQSTIALIKTSPSKTGLVDPASGKWHLYNDAGEMTTSFYYGNPGDYPFMGDWNCSGTETPGLYRQSDGYAYLRNSNTQGESEIKFFFGNPGDVPIAGDFNGDGCHTLSIYRPSSQTFHVINKLGQNDGGLGAAEFSYVFGNPGDKPFVGDFDGDGVETVGLHRESTGLVYFRNSHTQGIADAQFIFGNPGDRLIAGDWNSDGMFSPALYRPSNTTMFFRYTNSQGNADAHFVPNPNGAAWLPVAGKR